MIQQVILLLRLGSEFCLFASCYENFGWLKELTEGISEARFTRDPDWIEVVFSLSEIFRTI
jgi:hypothetical protein